MAIRKTPIIDSEYYHIYNRGSNKMNIFNDEEDYSRFIKLLYLCNSKKKINFRTDIFEKKIDIWEFDKGEPIVSIGAYTLMPNHFHIYITGSRSKASGDMSENTNSITIFLQKLSTAYAKYFNYKYKRTGSLFESKFKSTHIKDEIQAKYLFSYIHLNPIKIIDKTWKDSGIKNTFEALSFLANYKWSSYLDFKDIDRKEKIIINQSNFLNYFPIKNSFDKEILEWFSRSKASGEEKKLR